MRPRTIAIVTAVALLGATLSASYAVAGPRRAPTAEPTDVPAGAWYREALTWVLANGGLTLFPDGTFRPRTGVSRLHLLTALWRLEGRPRATGPSAVADVAADSRHRPAVDWAVERGLFDLSAEQRLRPDNPLSRATVALVLWRLADRPTDHPGRQLLDVPPGARYRQAADWALDRGVLRPRADQRLQPRAQLNRAQLAAALFAARSAPPDPRPNLVTILTDDQTVEQLRVMTQVQRLLADQGTTFTNAFATFPLCCPARATLLTGRYAHNTGVRNNVLPLGGYARLDHRDTIATWLHAAGYATAHVGKYLNCYGSADRRCGAGEPTVPPGWDDWFGLPDPYPRNYGYMEFTALDNGTLRQFGPGHDVYQTDVLADRAVADIENLSVGNRPFLLNVWVQAPHSGPGPTAPNSASPAPAPRYAGSYSGTQLPATPSFGEPDVSDKPAYVQGWFADRWSGTERHGLTRSYQASLESLRSVDDLVGRVVDALDRTGELDQTVIVFTSDNGLTFGEHRMKWWKVVPYEESIRVPLIVRGPGFPAGATATQAVGNIDLAPTFVELAGAGPQAMDGRSLLPLARDPSVAADRAVLLENWPDGTSQAVPHYDGIRARDWVYVEYATGERELYDLRADPYQLDSRAGDPAFATRQATLAAALSRLRDCTGSACEVTVGAAP